MKDLTRWSSKISTICLGGFLLISANEAGAGILSILKHGRPDAKGSAPGVEQGSVTEWQRVAFVGSAKVRQIKGKVEILSGVDRWSELSTGKVLQPGDMIRTHENSKAIVQMTASGSLISVTPKTVMRLTAIEKGWDKSVLSGKEELEGYSVRSLRGVAEFKGSDRKWKPVAVNAVLPMGAKVRTEAGTTMDLFHPATGSFLRVKPKAQLNLDPTIKYSTNLVAVQTGPHLLGPKTAQAGK